MDDFIDLFAMFLDLDRVRTLAVCGGSDILICVLRMNGGLTGLERHEGE